MLPSTPSRSPDPRPADRSQGGYFRRHRPLRKGSVAEVVAELDGLGHEVAQMHDVLGNAELGGIAAQARVELGPQSFEGAELDTHLPLDGELVVGNTVEDAQELETPGLPGTSAGSPNPQETQVSERAPGIRPEEMLEGPAAGPEALDQRAADYETLQVLFATNRVMTGSRPANYRLTAAGTDDGKLSYGQDQL